MAGDIDPDRYIAAVEVYNNGFCKVIRSGYASTMVASRGSRGMIKELSFRSRMKMLETALTSSVEFNSMMTLTYPNRYPLLGAEVKKHLHTFNTMFFRECPSEYFWFLEFQNRGAPHYHVLSQISDIEDADRSTMADCWVRSIGLHKDSAYMGVWGRERAIEYKKVYLRHMAKEHYDDVRETEGAIRYLIKYATKPYQKEVPESYRDVGRFWGCSRGVRENKRDFDRYPINADLLRNVLEMNENPVHEWRYIPTYLLGNSGLERGD